MGSTGQPRAARFTGPSDDVDDPLIGEAVAERMKTVRTEIDHIREHWDQYTAFLADLRRLFDLELAVTRTAANEHSATASRLLAQLLDEDREWLDSGRRDSFDLSAVRLYTSESGYRSVFGRLNEHLRQVPTAEWQQRLRTLVFLVELLNIDLFNLVMVDESTRDFVGHVHRGLSVDGRTAKKLSEVQKRPVGDRYWSVPLALMSTSRSTDVASEFMLAGLQHRDSDRIPVALEVHVAGLSQYWRDHYASRFPTSVVTSLCAVPLATVSAYPEEDEVLLRGPFFEILTVDESRNGLRIVAVISNANRDHPSTSRLAPGDAAVARRAMALLSAEARGRLASEVAATTGSPADSSVLRRRTESIERELIDLFGEDAPARAYDQRSMRGLPPEHHDGVAQARETYRAGWA